MMHRNTLYVDFVLYSGMTLDEEEGALHLKTAVV